MKKTLATMTIALVIAIAYAPHAQAKVSRDCWAEFSEEVINCPWDWPEFAVCAASAELNLLRCISDVIFGDGGN